MLRKEAWLSLGFTLAAVWVAHVAVSDTAAWCCGFAGIVIVIVILVGQEEEPQKAFTPTAKEIHETAAALARRQKAELDLETMRREQATEQMIRKIEELQAATKREKGFSVSLTSVSAAPGEDPGIVADAWKRYQKELRNRPMAGGRWQSRFS
jgi:hypothetical protein